MPAAGRDAGHARAARIGEVVGVQAGERDDDEHQQHAELDQHHDRVDPGRLAWRRG